MIFNPLPGRWIRCARIASIAVVLMAAAVVRAGDSTAAFDGANQASVQGRFAEAERGFESVIAKQGYSAPALFNLANAQQRCGRLGLAILNYERAALLAPDDPDIAANIAVARQRSGVQAHFGSRFSRAARGLTFDGWYGVAATAILAAAAGIVLRSVFSRWRSRLNLGIAVTLCAAAVAAAGLIVRGLDRYRAVVIAPGASASISPVSVAQPLFKLEAGEVVTWRRAHGDYALIRNPAGQEGWVKAADVAAVTPRTAGAGSARH